MQFKYLLPVTLIIALAVRLWHIAGIYPLPLFDSLIIDSQLYDEWGKKIAKGDWLGGDRAFYMDPLYPYLLAILYRIFGHDLLIARVVQALLGVATTGLVAFIGRRIGGHRVGLVAALLTALYQPLVFEGGEIEKTSVAVFLATASLAFAICNSTPSKLAAGICLALGSLCRGNLLLLAPLGALYFLAPLAEAPMGPIGLKEWLEGRSWKNGLAFMVGVMLVLSPVMMRNHYVSGEWVVTTAQAGANFYTGNNPANRSGANDQIPFVRALPGYEQNDFQAKAEELTGRKLSQKEVSSFWFREALRHIANDPSFAAKVFLRKCILFWSDLEIPDGWSLYFVRIYSPALRASFITFGWLLPFAVVGVIVSCRRNDKARLLLGYVLVYALSVVIFFVLSRYRIFVVPPLAVFAALGLQWLWERFREKNWRRFVQGVTGLIAVALFSFCTTTVLGYRSANYINDYAHLAELYEDRGDFNAAEALLQKALHLEPDEEAILCASGMLSLQKGDTLGAVKYINGCLKQDDEYPNAWFMHGMAHEKLGDFSTAQNSYKKQLAVVPGHAQARINLERLLRRSSPALY